VTTRRPDRDQGDGGGAGRLIASHNLLRDHVTVVAVGMHGGVRANLGVSGT
jgi:hypothetical protein